MSTESKRVKRWAPKVFSGCLTCKYDQHLPQSFSHRSQESRRRRIKCDETKPSCLRYGTPANCWQCNLTVCSCGRSNLQCEGYAPPQPRIFEPNKKGERSQRAAASQQDRRPSGTSSSSSSPPPTVASRLVLNAEDQQSYDFYLRETAAVGAIYSRRHFWMVIVPQTSIVHPAVKHSLLALSIVHEAIMVPERVNQPDDGRLLHHYNAAIRAITQGQPTTDIVLITTVMFFLIDLFTGRASCHHMEAAVNILDEFKASKNHTQSPYYETISEHIEPLIQAIRLKQSSMDQPDPLMMADIAFFTSMIPTPDNPVAQIQAVVQSLLRLTTQAVHMANLQAEINQLYGHLFEAMGTLSRFAATPDEHLYSARLFFIHHVMALTILRELREHFKIPETLWDDGIVAMYTFVVDRLETYLSQPQQADSVSGTNPWNQLGFIAPLFITVVRSPDEDLAERALRLLRNLKVTEGQWTSDLAANIAEALAQADIQDALGFDLSNLVFERKPHSLRIYADGQEAGCDHYLPLPAAELERVDWVSCSFNFTDFYYTPNTSLAGRYPAHSTVLRIPIRSGRVNSEHSISGWSTREPLV